MARRERRHSSVKGIETTGAHYTYTAKGRSRFERLKGKLKRKIERRKLDKQKAKKDLRKLKRLIDKF